MIADPAPMLKKAIIVDDHPMMREMLKIVIVQQAGMLVCGEADNVHDALRIHDSHRPDLAIVDLTLKDSNGLDFIKILRERSFQTPVLVISMHSENIYAERVMRAGANGYISKGESIPRIAGAMRKVAEGGVSVSEQVMESVIRKLGSKMKTELASDLDALSDREMEIFRLFGLGLNSREISRKIHLAVSSVDSYRARIRVKLGIRNAAELYQRAAYWVSEQGLQQ